jgi:hypothetical protein
MRVFDLDAIEHTHGRFAQHRIGGRFEHLNKPR